MLLVLGAACIAVASVIGGATGFGTAMVATPLMLLAGFGVSEVVVINLVAGLVTRLDVVCRLWRQIDRRRVALLGAGSLPGAWLGAVTAQWLPEHQLKQVVGVLIVMCGVAMALVRSAPPYSPSTGAQTLTGVIGGYLSTTTSLNGPPPVLLLMRARLEPLSFIADLAGYFIVTNLLSLAILVGRGAVPASIWWPAVPLLVTAAVAGNIAGLWIARRLSLQSFHNVVVVLVVLAGVLTATVG
jgi:uncharacterized membrane protein YfcA